MGAPMVGDRMAHDRPEATIDAVQAPFRPVSYGTCGTRRYGSSTLSVRTTVLGKTFIWWKKEKINTK
jgi:hypothetical protein